MLTEITAPRVRAADKKLSCTICDAVADVSERQRRHYLNSGATFTCPTCRMYRKPMPQPRPADRRYWLERFSMDEIREIGVMIWGEAV